LPTEQLLQYFGIALKSLLNRSSDVLAAKVKIEARIRTIEKFLQSEDEILLTSWLPVWATDFRPYLIDWVIYFTPPLDPLFYFTRPDYNPRKLPLHPESKVLTYFMPCETEYLDLLKTVGINFIDLESPSHSDISLVKIKGRLRGDRDLLNDSETALKNFCELYTLKHPLRNIFIDLQKLDSYDLLNSFSILNAPGMKNFGLTVPDEFVNESTDYIPFKGRKQEKRRLKKNGSTSKERREEKITC